MTYTKHEMSKISTKNILVIRIHAVKDILHVDHVWENLYFCIISILLFILVCSKKNLT